MKKLTAEDVQNRSTDLLAGDIEKLKALFPEAWTDGRIDFDVLKQLLGGAVDEGDEKFGLNWHGKRRARQLALTPSTGTLRPCREESVDWDATRNLMIKGDNLEVLKLLQNSYGGRVKLIYIDPPYNTGKDFVYPDNFQDNIRNYLELTGQTDDGGRKLTSNPESSGRYHTDWLNMMYPRLRLARNLLRDDGIIFVSIDDNEISHLRLICDDVFFPENFLGCVIWQKKYAPANDTIDLSATHDYVLVYAKARPSGQTGQPEAILAREERTDKTNSAYKNLDNDSRGLWRADNYKCNKTADERPNLYYSIIQPNTGEEIWPQKTSVWRYNREKHEQNVRENRVWWGVDGTNQVPAYKRFLDEVEGVVAQTIWLWSEVGHNDEAKKEVQNLFPDCPDVFQTPKPTRLIRKMLVLGTSSESDDIVLDFFGGSGTTGQAVFSQNAADGGTRRFILVQLPEPTDRKDYPTIAEITKERLRRAGRKTREDNPLFAGDLGFRIFNLDSSNIKAWDPNYENLEQTLLDSVEHVKVDRSEADVLYELLLKLDLDLCVPIEARQVAGKAVHAIGGGTLFACLDRSIERDAVEAVAHAITEWRAELNPAGEVTCVFLDSAFADDVAKSNMAAILEQNGIPKVRSL